VIKEKGRKKILNSLAANRLTHIRIGLACEYHYTAS